MLRTITIGSAVSIQGIFVRNTSDGRMTVQVDNAVYTGKPVHAKS